MNESKRSEGLKNKLKIKVAKSKSSKTLLHRCFFEQFLLATKGQETTV